jgi:DNA processing protein
MDERELGYLLAVAAASVWSPRAVATWLRALGSPRALVENVREPPLLAVDGPEKLADETRARLSIIDDTVARNALEAANASGASIVLQADADYPAALRDLCDAPLVLYVRGRLECLGERAVAIVGSRAATAYGRNVASTMAAEFAAFGATVVSGLARGIDAAAHRGAIDAGLATVAVLGSGVRALYPQYHALLADEIVERGGAVISEFAPSQPARAFQFPMRNRIVAALAHATIVVEASSRSGALITARLADELGRSVFAIPGDVGRPTSAGTNALIADGVPLVTSATDVAALMRWQLSFPRVEKHTGAASEIDTNAALLALLTQPQTVDELAAASGASAAEIAAQLVVLELQGAVERSAGGSYTAVCARAALKPPG